MAEAENPVSALIAGADGGAAVPERHRQEDERRPLMLGDIDNYLKMLGQIRRKAMEDFERYHKLTRRS